MKDFRAHLVRCCVTVRRVYLEVKDEGVIIACSTEKDKKMKVTAFPAGMINEARAYMFSQASFPSDSYLAEPDPARTNAWFVSTMQALPPSNEN